MFNVAVIDGKRIIKFIIAITFVVLIAILLKQSSKLKNVNINKSIESTAKQVYSHSFIDSMNNTIASLKYINTDGYTNKVKNKISLVDFILNKELSVANSIVSKSINSKSFDEESEDDLDFKFWEIPNQIKTEVIEENNIIPSYTNTYESVEIKNRTNYELTDDVLVPNIEIENKKDIIIFHTHTCESYTQSEAFNYEMTGNYRTTDPAYSVVRVGDELTGYLEYKGYNVIHNSTLHDYPAYSGSYERSIETVSNILQETNAQVILDIHRDAVGNGSDYGPTVKINDEIAAQLMIVVGTDAGGLNHPNWRENLKFAIKLQAKANELYPGLFRPINLSTSRYNQNLAKGALIIEVGATGNTMDQCLVSMKYLASVLDNVLN